jgi:holo-[acyl-carrier protein] synthase
MIVGLGIDIAEPARIEAAAARFGRRFLERVFTPREMVYCDGRRNRFQRYAARFAAKEAGMKALGTGWRRGVTWRDFEVVNLPSGRPTLRLSGAAAAMAAALKVRNVVLSISHTAGQSIAQVILESEE